MRNNTGVRINKGAASLDQLRQALEILSSQEVLVGYPEDADQREDPKQPTNAQLAYIHDNGAPEANIPQREFMRTGVDSRRDDVRDELVKGMRRVLRGGGPEAAEQALVRAGFKAVNGIKAYINDGVEPPLSDRTLRERLKSKRKNGGGARLGAAIELDRRWDGQAPSTEFAKPLVDTGQMRNAATYVIRKRGGRRMTPSEERRS